MFDDETASFLRSGCALIVGSASADGRPHASRGWGVPQLTSDDDQEGLGERLTVLLDGEDERARANATPGRKVAVTATDVRTLRSIQLKGDVVATSAAEPEDPKVVRAYCDAFFTDVVQTDGMPREILERMVPGSWFRCVVQVTARFDQTPGPSAGAPIVEAR